MMVNLIVKERNTRAGYSLIEVLVAFGLIGILMVSLFSAFSTGFISVRLVREDQRATQVLLEKMEVLRLYSWDQINTSGFVPVSYKEAFYVTNGSSSGLIYTGKITIANAPISESYSNDMRKVTVEVDWSSGNMSHHREISTFVSQYGLQNYIY